MASPGIISNTNAVDVNIQAAAPLSMGGVSAAKRSVGIVEISNNKKAGRSTVFIRLFSRFGISQFLGITLTGNTNVIFHSIIVERTRIDEELLR
jgi:hypothetical protein